MSVPVKVKGRSLSDFGDLLDAEKLLLSNCGRGTPLRLGAAKPCTPTSTNHIRGEFLRFLLLGADGSVTIHERGIQISFAYVSGILDLEFASVLHGFFAQGCFFEGALKCSRADFKRDVGFFKSSISGLAAHGISVAGNLDLRDIESKGGITLDGAKINGSLNFSGASIDGCGSWAISGKDACIQGDALLSRNFKAVGGVNLFCAKITGQLNCNSGSFSNEGYALAADGIKVGSGVFLCRGFKSRGEVRFVGADIEGQMSLQGARLKARSGQAFSADRIRINGSLYLDQGFQAKGLVSLKGARISAQLSCRGARITGRSVRSISADRLVVEGSVFISEGFYAKGRVSFVGAKISGDLCLRGARKIEELSSARMEVKGSLIVRNLENPLSKVSLAGARVTALNDDALSWGDHLLLNGFVFSQLDVHNSMSVKDRVGWLEKQCASLPRRTNTKLDKLQTFLPQPWQQLKSVLEDMGRTEDAREIGIEYERHRVKCGQIGLTPETWGALRRGVNSGVAKTLHFFYGKLIGYGYRPMQLVPWFLGVWLLTTVLYWYAGDCQKFCVRA